MVEVVGSREDREGGSRFRGGALVSACALLSPESGGGRQSRADSAESRGRGRFHFALALSPALSAVSALPALSARALDLGLDRPAAAKIWSPLDITQRGTSIGCWLGTMCVWTLGPLEGETLWSGMSQLPRAASPGDPRTPESTTTIGLQLSASHARRARFAGGSSSKNQQAQSPVKHDVGSM